ASREQMARPMPRDPPVTSAVFPCNMRPPNHNRRVTATDTHRAIDTVWRMESARLIAGLARIVRDIGIAEELAQDALVAALEQWPESGVPRNPGAWLMAAAKHRAIAFFRRTTLLERKQEQLGSRQQTVVEDLDAALDDDVGDDLLRL